MICSPWLICFLIFVSPRFSWTMRSCHWQNLWISVSRLWPHSPPSSPQHWLRSAGNSKKITTIHHEKTLSTNIAPSISVTQFSLTNINLYNSPPPMPRRAVEDGGFRPVEWRWTDLPQVRWKMKVLKVLSSWKFRNRKLKNEKSPVEWRWTDFPQLRSTRIVFLN